MANYLNIAVGGLVLPLEVAGETPAVAPWFEDSFEGAAPTGWKSNWAKSTGTLITTNEVGGAPDSGNYALKQAWPDENQVAALVLDFSSVPTMPATIGPGDSFYMSWYTYYDPLFDWTGTTGFKQVLVYQKDNSYVGRIYVCITEAGLWLQFQNSNPGHDIFYANVNGGSYIFPKGEWVKQEWYVYCSPETESAGILKGWINGVLRWDYSNIPTMLGEYPYFTLNINSTFNQKITGPNQNRYFDRFVFGPGSIAPL